MVPNILIHEQLMVEQVRERQRQSEQQRLLAYLQKPHSRHIQHVMKSFRPFFVAFCTHPKQFDTNPCSKRPF
jgi:hypothetical protein